jgi:hypothetical protein
MLQRQLPGAVCAWARYSMYYNVRTVPQHLPFVLVGRQRMQASFGRLKHWLITWEHRLDFWPAFKGALAAHEWAIWPFFLLLVVIFFLLLPRACRYP